MPVPDEDSSEREEEENPGQTKEKGTGPSAPMNDKC